MTKAQLQAEIERLTDKCDRQATILQWLNPENYPGIFFICGASTDRDANGLPDRIHVCPAFGCGWSEIYERKSTEATH